MSRILWLVLATPLLVAGMTAGATVTGPHGVPGAIGLCSAATYAHRVALVAEHSNGGVIRVCIGFDGATITAEQVLQAGGVEYATASYGSLGDAVCQIDREPASYPATCWTSSSPYWVLFVAQGSNAWSPAARGVSTQTLSDGDAVGFRYDPQNAPDPPPPSAAGTCAQTAAGSTTATTSPTRPPAATPAPALQTASPIATATAVPSSAPLHAGVIGAGPHATPTGARAGQSGVDPALLLAAGGGGALAGLLVVQLLRRRRKAA